MKFCDSKIRQRGFAEARGRERKAQNILKVLMCSPEVEPFAKTGGLGDVLGSLPKTLAKKGIDIRVNTFYTVFKER